MMLKKLWGIGKRINKTDDPVSLRVQSLCDAAKKSCETDSPFAGVTFTVIDTETTGLDTKNDKLLNIAAVRLQNLKITDRYETIINPKMPIPQKSTDWHGITDSMVKDSPSIEAVLPELAEFIGSSVIVGHHVSFDIKMINKDLKYFFNTSFQNAWLDTMLIHSHIIMKKDIRSTLDDLMEIYDVKCSKRHTALPDAEAAAEIFIKLLQKTECSTVRELIFKQKQHITLAGKSGL